MSLSFIHAADFHLGANLHRFGPARTQLETAQYRALELTLEAALVCQADFVLICGDLFDSRNPSPAIVDRTQSIFDRYPAVAVLILPGTHDFLSEGSIFSSSKSRWAPANVVILNGEQAMPFRLPDSDTYLYFHPNRTNRSTRSPIHGLTRSADGGLHIGIAHGSLNLGRPGFGADFPIDPSEIEKSGLDYLALGHWHAPGVDKYGKTTVAYSGIPQPISFSDPEIGSVYHVRVDNQSPISPELIATSTIRLKSVSADIYHPQDLENLLEEHANDKTIIKMDLRYSDKLKETYALKEIIAKAESRFLLVQKNSQKVRLAGSLAEATDGVNQPLIDAFKAELLHLREVDSPERSAIYERASELGIKLIKGEL
jgi:DNA repair exonuclease SbcCD nuclease subunit